MVKKVTLLVIYSNAKFNHSYMNFRFSPLYLLGLLLAPLALSAQLVLQVGSLPNSTPAGSTIFAAGSFNTWAAGDAAYSLTNNGQGGRQLSLNISPGTYEFKFTRGSWASVEGTAQGGFRPNRVIQYNGGLQQESLTIAGWEDQAASNSTATANVSVLSESFYMPQLNRNRKIWVYLPPDYATSNRSYPVLYMHDAQNLFDDATSFSGEWQVDESLNRLFEEGDNGIIVIAIENGGADRLAEMTPWSNPSYGGGDGEAYVDFIVQNLKPYVDANLRTLADQPHTGIMGSSLGGLISLYAIIRYQEVFGKAGILSPSLWFTDDIYNFVTSTGKQADVRIAFVAGEQESSDMVPDMQAMYNTLRNVGFSADELSFATDADGQHSEWYWRREFPPTYQWLFQTSTVLEGSVQLRGLRYWPNPSVDTLYLEGLPASNSAWQARFYDGLGRLAKSTVVQNDQISLRDLISGHYYLVLHNENDQWAVIHLQKVE